MTAAAIAAFRTGAIVAQPDMVKVTSVTITPGQNQLSLLTVDVLDRVFWFGHRSHRWIDYKLPVFY